MADIERRLVKAWLEPRSVRYYPSRGVTYESHLAPPPHLVGLRIAALDALQERGDGFGPNMGQIRSTPPEGELEDLWLDPRLIGRGIGRRLLEHALGIAAELGFDS